MAIRGRRSYKKRRTRKRVVETLDESIHSEKTIINKLDKKFFLNHKYKVPNAFIFGWESDFFVQKDNGYCIEFEIKISRVDFFNDKKKVEKHLVLERGIRTIIKQEYVLNEETNKKHWKETKGEEQVSFRPNKFFYVVPRDLIKIEEIPSYAGLMYIDETGVHTIKEAPFIHRVKLEFEKVLCIKFYWYWIKAKQTIKVLEKEIERLKNRRL